MTEGSPLLSPKAKSRSKFKTNLQYNTYSKTESICYFRCQRRDLGNQQHTRAYWGQWQLVHVRERLEDDPSPSRCVGALLSLLVHVELQGFV